jgi:hypothetical protein
MDTMTLKFVSRGLIKHPLGEQLYTKAHVDNPDVKAVLENATVPFWEYTLKQMFDQISERVALSSQQPASPQSKKACDLLLSAWNENSETNSAICFIELKRPTEKTPAKLKILENQVLGYCREYLDYHEEDQYIFAGTGVATHIRLWIVRRGISMELEPLWGSPKLGEWINYYDTGDEERGKAIEGSFFNMLNIICPQIPNPGAQQGGSTQYQYAAGPRTHGFGSQQGTPSYIQYAAAAPTAQQGSYSVPYTAGSGTHGFGGQTAQQGSYSVPYSVAYAPPFTAGSSSSIGGATSGVAGAQQSLDFASSSNTIHDLDGPGAERVSVSIQGDDYRVRFHAGQILKKRHVFERGKGISNGKIIECYWYKGTSGMLYWTETLPKDVKGKGKGRA